MIYLRLLAIVCSLFVGSALRAGDENAIRDVISLQIGAFEEDDLASAFEFASPKIKAMFVTPENFGRMVETGYPMIWRPSRFDFLGLRQDEGRLIERLLVRDAGGREFVFDYHMISGPNGWRIDGVYPVPLTDVGV